MQVALSGHRDYLQAQGWVLKQLMVLMTSKFTRGFPIELPIPLSTQSSAGLHLPSSDDLVLTTREGGTGELGGGLEGKCKE